VGITQVRGRGQGVETGKKIDANQRGNPQPTPNWGGETNGGEVKEKGNSTSFGGKSWENLGGGGGGGGRGEKALDLGKIILHIKKGGLGGRERGKKGEGGRVERIGLVEGEGGCRLKKPAVLV